MEYRSSHHCHEVPKTEYCLPTHIRFLILVSEISIPPTPTHVADLVTWHCSLGDFPTEIASLPVDCTMHVYNKSAPSIHKRPFCQIFFSSSAV